MTFVLTDQRASLQECLPTDISIMDEYQASVATMAIRDERGTIQGLHPVAYFYDGLVEELEEVTGQDKNEPNYSRMGALLLIEGDDALQPQAVTPAAVERQLKEFGDVSWYLANFLQWFGIEFSAVVEPGRRAWERQHHSNFWSRTGYLQDIIDRQHPVFAHIDHTGRLAKAAEDMTRVIDGRRFPNHRDDRISNKQELMVASGLYVMAATLLLHNRFDMTYEDIFTQNIAKVQKRIADNTVFEKSGGDDR